MKKKEATGFKIIIHHKQNSLKKYKNMMVMSVCENRGAISRPILDFLQLKNPAEILFAIKDGRLFIANVTDHFLRGLHVCVPKRCVDIAYINTSKIIHQTINRGVYLMCEDEIYDTTHKLSWYELKPIDIENENL